MYYLPLQPAREYQRSCFSWHEHFDQESAGALEDTSDYGNEEGLVQRIREEKHRSMPLLLELKWKFDIIAQNISMNRLQQRR